MTKQEIITDLCNRKIVEKFINNTAKYHCPEFDDLAQDVYLILLEYEDEKIVGLYERNELDFFISRIITNQLISTSSPFYCKYRKFLHNTEELKNNNIQDGKSEWMTLRKN